MSSQRIRAQAIADLERGGRVTPTRLVEAAKSKKHLLYKDFDWNDKTAAHTARLAKAREIINSVRVVITTTTHKITSVGYVRDPQSAPGEQGYVSVATLRNDADYAREALDAEVERVKSHLERAREFATAVGLSGEMEIALASIMNLHSRSRRGPPGQRIDDRPHV